MNFKSILAALNYPKSNLGATAAPTATDDDTKGFAVGSVWVDTVAQNTYRCVDASTGAAVWNLLITSGVALSGDVSGTLPGPITVIDGADGSAIHDDQAGEINAVTAKVTPVSTDVVLIEDSAAGFAKKRARLDALPVNLHASSHQHGGGDEVATGTPGANAIPKADGAGVFADGWISESSVTQHEAAIDHDALTNYAIAQHRIINDSGNSATELWSASKIEAMVTAASAGFDVKDPIATGTLVGDGNIVLTGEQTINGVLTSTNRVVLSDQTTPSENGPWLTDAGAWSRPTDFDTDAEVTNGAEFFVDNPSSTVYRYKFILTTADPIIVDTTALTFVALRPLDFGTTGGTAAEGNDSRIPTQDENDALAGTGTPSAGDPYVNDSDTRLDQATEGSLGISEIATQAEVDARTDDLRFITPLKYATTPLKKRTLTPSAINITLVAADIGKVILLTAGANATLPDPAVAGSGWWVDIKEAANLTTSDIVRNGGENLDGSAADINLGKYEARTLVTDGTDWWSI